MSRVFAFLCALLLAGSAAATDWPQVRFDNNRSGYNSAETTIGPSNVGSLQIAWSQALPGTPTQPPAQVAIANGVMYIEMGNGPLVAYSASGCGSPKCTSRLWQTPPGLTFPFGNSIQIADGVVYAAGFNSTANANTVLYAFAAGGCGASVCSPLWHGTVVAPHNDLGAVTVANGRVYSGGVAGNLYVYDAAGCPSGACQPLWVGKTTAASLGTTATVVDGKVYANGIQSPFYVFDAGGCGSGTCQPLWTVPCCDTPAPPVVDGMLFLQAYKPSKSVRAFDANGCGASKCGPLWETDSDSGYNGSQAVAEGILYAGYSNVGIRAFAAAGCGQATCTQLWTLDSHGVALSGSMTVANGLVFGIVGVPPSAKLMAWPAQPCGQDLCEPIWTSPEGGFVAGEPLIVDGRLYAVSVSGRRLSIDVYALP